MDPPKKDLTLTDVFVKFHQDYPVQMAILYGSLALIALLVLIGMWLLWGAGPRRRRGLRAARKLLQTGAWQVALDHLTKVRAIGSPSASWVKRFDQFEAECLQAAMKAAGEAKKFEDALEFGQRVAHILDQPEHEVRMSVQSAMLQEIRRLFSKQGETRATLDLIARTLAVQAPCREASFWRALCEVRNGALESALAHLQIAYTGSPAEPESAAAPAPTSSFIDPPLYLGAILLRIGRAKEALRYLTEANRMDAACPFITLQLGTAIVTAGGDTNMAVRALQRSLGPKGLGLWQDNPQRAWVEGFPEHRAIRN